MATDSRPPLVPNTLGKASLILGILASTLVFSVGLCAGVGQQQGWLQHAGPLLFVLGGTFAFLGLVSSLLGLGGLFGRHRSRAAAIFGLILGLVALVLFAAIVNAVQTPLKPKPEEKVDPSATSDTINLVCSRSTPAHRAIAQACRDATSSVPGRWRSAA